MGRSIPGRGYNDVRDRVPASRSKIVATDHTDYHGLIAFGNIEATKAHENTRKET